MVKQEQTTVTETDGAYYIRIPANVRKDSQFNKELLNKDNPPIVQIYGSSIKIKENK